MAVQKNLMNPFDCLFATKTPFALKSKDANECRIRCVCFCLRASRSKSETNANIHDAHYMRRLFVTTSYRQAKNLLQIERVLGGNGGKTNIVFRNLPPIRHCSASVLSN